VNLMNELDKIKRIAAREVPGAPQEVLLVLDATVAERRVAGARVHGRRRVNGSF
jgi:Signal recognition particle GTPase